jgi:ribosomal protein S27AE
VSGFTKGEKQAPTCPQCGEVVYVAKSENRRLFYCAQCGRDWSEATSRTAPARTFKPVPPVRRPPPKARRR